MHPRTSSFVLLILTCCSLCSAQDTPRRTLDLYLVAGQSNAVGYDANPAVLVADDHDQQVKFWFRCGDPPPDEFDSRSTGWATLQPQPKGQPDTAAVRERQYGNFQSLAGGFGPEIGFARGIRTHQQDRPYGIVKASFSGTSLIHDWDPTDAGDKGACYRSLVAETKAAIAAAQEQGFDCQLQALIWVQGESDAAADAQERYCDAIVKMLSTLRTDLNAPKLWALLGVNTRFLAMDNKITPGMEAVIAGQQAASKLDSHCRYVDLDGATLANAFHFDAAGTLEIGQRFAKAYLEATSPLAGKTPKVLILGIDGCRLDAWQAATTPHLDQLVAEGILFEGTDIRSERNADEADTISGPGWSNLLTGVWPDKHNVLNNQFTEPHYDQFPHFFVRLKEVHPTAVTASFSDWQPIAEKIVRAADVNEHFLEDNDYETGDTHAAMACVQYLQTADPEVVVLYLGQVDETGHKHGFHPAVPEYVAAIERVDGHIGTVLTAIQSRPTYVQENWLTLVCTDHGGLGTNHSGGHHSPEVRRTFMIVSGPTVQRGSSDAPTFQVDVVATALKHLGVEAKSEWQLDGKPVGLAP